jgi:spore germination protein GerM
MRRLLVGGLLIAVLAWAAWRWLPGRPGLETPVSAKPDSVSTGFKAVRLYFAAPSGDSLIGESRELAEAQGLHERVRALVGALDRGPSGGGIAALPAGTSVLNVYVSDRGVLTLDLSRAFRQGFRGGSRAEYLAVASLVRTLGANLPEVQRVLLVCGGAPMTSLGGHLPLDRPIDVSEMP